VPPRPFGEAPLGLHLAQLPSPMISLFINMTSAILRRRQRRRQGLRELLLLA
jgi:hypothetical protein